MPVLSPVARRVTSKVPDLCLSFSISKTRFGVAPYHVGLSQIEKMKFHVKNQHLKVRCP